MCEIMEKIAKEERAEGRAEGIQLGITKGKSEGKLEILFGLVKDGILTITEAAQRANMTETVFVENMKQFKA